MASYDITTTLKVIGESFLSHSNIMQLNINCTCRFRISPATACSTETSLSASVINFLPGILRRRASV